MSRALYLYRLQQLDQKAEKAERRLSEIAGAMGESGDLRRARKAAAAAAQRVKQLATRRKDLELEVEGIKGEIAASERRLYSGTIRNPKELEDLQNKVRSLKQFLDKREEELLEAMIALEEAEEEREREENHLAATEAAWKENQDALRREQERLKADLDEAARDREALLPQIQPGDLDLYQSLRRGKGGLVVAVMRDRACTACGMEVPPGQLERGREAGLLFCGNCERILVPEKQVR